jgi:hypothetical protein
VSTSDIYAVRRRNLRQVIVQYEGATNLARRLGYTSPSFLSQLVGPRHNRQITEKVARHVEDRLSLPLGWLDKPHRETGTPLTEDQISEVVEFVGQVVQDMKAAPSPRQFAELVALVHEKGGMDERFTRRLVTLINNK